MNKKFDLDAALELVKQGSKIDRKDGVLAPLIKQLTEAALRLSWSYIWLMKSETARTVNPPEEKGSGHKYKYYCSLFLTIRQTADCERPRTVATCC